MCKKGSLFLPLAALSPLRSPPAAAYDDVVASRVVPLLAALAAAGCDGPAPPAAPDGGRDAAADGAPDGADGGSDADSDEAPELLECDYPERPYGLATGDVLEPFWLWTCEGELSSLPREWCGQRATVVHLSTTWCSVCEEATRRLVAEVIAPFAGEPVALVEILVEEGAGDPGSLEGCRGWSRRFAPPLEVHVPPEATLEGPLGRLADSGAPPLAILLDGDGRIQDWSRLFAPDLMDDEHARLREAIQQILDEP